MATSQFPTEVVLRACEAFTANREALVTSNRENLIYDLMNRWWFPVKARDKAIEILKRPGSGIFCMSKWDYEDVMGQRWQGRVDVITTLARAAQKNRTESVMLSDTDSQVLEPWLSQLIAHSFEERRPKIIIEPERTLSEEEIGLLKMLIKDALAEFYENRVPIDEYVNKRYDKSYRETHPNKEKQVETRIYLAEALRRGKITIEP